MPRSQPLRADLLSRSPDGRKSRDILVKGWSIERKSRYIPKNSLIILRN